jgi:Acetoacetate decarboxylase (ADC)
MKLPARLERQKGRHALVDGIPFALPVQSDETPVLMAAFLVDPVRAAQLLPGEEVHPVRLFGRGLLLLSVVNYQATDIGRYVEYSVALGVTHGPRPAPDFIPLILRDRYGFGQYVYDMPVSTEISVKGGKGIWGMPKHQANLDFHVTDDRVTSQYDLDGMLALRIEIDRPKHAWIPLRMSAVSYAQFRGFLIKSYMHAKGRMGVSPFPRGARLYIGDHPRVQPLKQLGISPRPLFTAFFPSGTGVLDDHFEGWFLTYGEPPTEVPEGLESVADLGLGQTWLEPPKAPYSGEHVTEISPSKRTA